MKYTPFILLIVIISAIIIHPIIHSNKSPHPGEIWRYHGATQMEAQVIAIEADNVKFKDLSTGDTLTSPVASFMGGSEKVGEVGPIRDTYNSFWKLAEADTPTTPREGDVCGDDYGRLHAMLDGKEVLLQKGPIVVPKGMIISGHIPRNLLVVDSSGSYTSQKASEYTKKQLDSAYRKGVKDGFKKYKDKNWSFEVGGADEGPIRSFTITGDDSIDILKSHSGPSLNFNNQELEGNQIGGKIIIDTLNPL